MKTNMTSGGTIGHFKGGRKNIQCGIGFDEEVMREWAKNGLRRN
jgi:hypothetical protein